MRKLLTGLLITIFILFAFLYRPSVSFDVLKSKYADEFSDFMEIGGMNAHYRKTGSGPPIVLVHGTSSSLHTWKHWQDRLSERFTVYSIDLPGCGLTGPHPDDNYSIDAYIDYLEEFTSKIGLDSFYIAGNSLGGHIAWEYAAISPKIKKAVLVDPSGFHVEGRKIPMVFRLGRKKVFSSIVEGLNVKPLIGASLKEVYHNDELVTKELKNRYYDLIRLKGNRKAFVIKVSNLEISDESELRSIHIPVLIEWGAEDLWIPVKLADIFTSNLPNSKLIMYEACGHVPQEELPERSAEDAMAFFINE